MSHDRGANCHYDGSHITAHRCIKLICSTPEMARVNTSILGISKLKWNGMGKFNSLYLPLWVRIP